MSQEIIQKLDAAMKLLEEVRAMYDLPKETIPPILTAVPTAALVFISDPAVPIVPIAPAVFDPNLPQMVFDYVEPIVAQIIDTPPTIKELITRSEWPEAVPSEHICNETEIDKQERAEGILEIFMPKLLTGMSFLDYGCGEGHVVKKVIENGASIAVGFDLVATGPFTWEQSENGMLTTDFEKIKNHARYDRVLIYDVLDHCGDSNTIDTILLNAISVLKPNGKIYVRCHPWTGRHGGHLYKSLNKAFAHFLLSDEELKEIGITLDSKIIKMLHPENTYKSCFRKNNLRIVWESSPSSN